MKLGSPKQNRVLVKIVQASAHKPKDKDDTKTTDYVTFETLEVTEATAEQVKTVVYKALEAASK